MRLQYGKTFVWIQNDVSFIFKGQQNYECQTQDFKRQKTSQVVKVSGH